MKELNKIKFVFTADGKRMLTPITKSKEIPLICVAFLLTVSKIGSILLRTILVWCNFCGTQVTLATTAMT